MPKAPHRSAPAALLLLLAGGCSLPLLETGRPPEGVTRDPETPESRDRADRRRAEREARAEAEAGEPEGAAEDGRLLGTSGNRRIHRADCAELLAAAPAERVPFGTYWDGLNAGYAPCPTCRPSE